VLLGVFYASGSQDYQVPCSRRGLDVSTGPNGFSPTAVHRSLSVAVSSSRELSASFRVLRPPTCPACPGQSCDHPEAVERLLWGSSPSSRHQPAASTVARSPNPRALWSVLDVSHVLDGLLRHQPCGFVSPRSHVQGLPFRGLSLPRSRTGFPRPRHALVPLSEPACGLTRASRPALDFRALLPARVRCRDEGVTSSSIRAPPGLRLLRVSLPSQRADDFAPAPPMTFTAMTPPRLISGVLPLRGSVSLGAGYRPARGF
jgi:hypothetical protein